MFRLSLVVFLNIVDLLSDSSCTRVSRMYPEQDAVGLYSLLTPKLLLCSPQLIQRVLVSDFSSFHDNDFHADEKLDPLFALDPFCLKGEE